MQSSELLNDGFDRIRGLVSSVVGGLPDERLSFRVDPEANTIAWLVWHLTRIQDDHIADAAGTEQLWLSAGWRDRFALPFAPDATGYGQSNDDVGAVQVAGELLIGYHDEVCAKTMSYVDSLSATDLDRIVDERWDPPVSLGVRLLSVLSDDLQHVGQAAIIRGVAERTA